MNKKILACYGELCLKALLVTVFSLSIIFGIEYLIVNQQYHIPSYFKVILGIILLSIVLYVLIPSIKKLEKYVVLSRQNK
ncbi:hypothetical protein AB835_09645 [Candidatus Endobugula sertula]|uniref:Uncharacterized protein n=1 Tax=Candidatus Endobugula sertula TaxID=62101 RepID=A0A1D2QNZ1_9GAMM|nr:hypothetical protein AB835_09645 [Candidatus Endobugula sertula]